MITNLRPMLLITLVFLSYLIWVEWQKDYGPQYTGTQAPLNSGQERLDPPSLSAPVSAEAGDLPAPEPLVADARPEISPPQMEASGQLVRVKTDVLELEIDPVGGTLVSSKLLNYPVDVDQPNRKVQLFSQRADRFFVAQSGLLSRQEAPNHTSSYAVSADEYELADGAEELRIPMTWRNDKGLAVTKTFILKRGRYDMEIRHTVDNQAETGWVGRRYEQLQRTAPLDDEKAGFNDPGRYSFMGIGFYSPEDKFEKIDFDEVSDEPFEKTVTNGWQAMIQHYFFAAWIPPSGQSNLYSTLEFKPAGWPRYITRTQSPDVAVAAGTRHEFSSRLFVGPKLQNKLQDIAPGLEHTVNYGIFTVFSKPLFWLLSKLHDQVGNWGWAIVLLTILIKLAFFKLTEAQYKSMARMRKLQPRIEALKERYGDDRQRMSQAMMEMYKKEKVNPLGGCLPILVQIPIFIALYWVLLESVELRQAPFVGWITNLSARDPYFILPLLNAVFMILTQRLTPMAGMDPLQRKMMNAMPVVFSIMFAFFPAGLVLYWATNAGLSLAQQWYITRKISASG